MNPNSLRSLLPGFIGLLLLLAVPAQTSASPQQSCSEPNADGIKVELNFAGSPVKTGSNEVVVKLYDAAGKPIAGAAVTVMAAELLHDQAENDHSHQARAESQADTGCPTETNVSGPPTPATEHDMDEMDSHQPAPATEHDMAAMIIHPAPTTEHDMAAMDSHQSAPTTEYDMAAMTVHPAPATEHDMAAMDSHQSAPTTEHDMDEMAVQTEPETGHGGGQGGHEETSPAELIAGPTPGEYQGQVSFNVEGRWLVKVNVSAQGQSKEVEFTFDVVKRGPNWYVLGGFLGVNMVVLATAAVMKQRAAKA